MNETKIRESNFELLRIVTMLFLVLLHFNTQALGLQEDTTATIACKSLFIIAVNVFVLISGYFGIRISWKGFVRLLAICLFYELLFFFLLEQHSIKSVLRLFMPLSHSNYWFITDYFYLWFLSPILNWTINNLNNNKRKFVVLLIIFAVFQFVFGWLERGKYDGSGYNLWNFIFLYFIGRFIALHTKEIRTLKARSICLSIYLSVSLLTALFAFIAENLFSIDSIASVFYSYNSPLVVVATVALLLFFRNLHFKSKVINWLASSALAVYLITVSWVASKYLYPFVDDLGKTIQNGWLLAILLFLLAIIIMIACLLFDKLRVLLSKPIENLLCKIPMEKWVKFGVDKACGLIK